MQFGILGLPTFILEIFEILERAKRAETASCRDTIVQKGGFGESVYFSPPLKSNPTIRAPPHKSHHEYHQCSPGVVYILRFS